MGLSSCVLLGPNIPTRLGMVPVGSVQVGLGSAPTEGWSTFPDLIIVGSRGRWEYVGSTWLVCGSPNNQVATISALAGRPLILKPGSVTDESEIVIEV